MERSQLMDHEVKPKHHLGRHSDTLEQHSAAVVRRLHSLIIMGMDVKVIWGF